MSGVADTIDSLKALADAGRNVELTPGTLSAIADYLEEAQSQYVEARAVAAGQGVAIAARVQARILNAAADQKMTRAATLRRHQWYLLAAQVVVFAVWSAGLWWWG